MAMDSLILCEKNKIDLEVKNSRKLLIKTKDLLLKNSFDLKMKAPKSG